MSLAHLRRFCEERRKGPLELTSCELRAFREGLLWRATQRGHLYSASTVDMVLRVARHFYRWAMLQGEL